MFLEKKYSRTNKLYPNKETRVHPKAGKNPKENKETKRQSEQIKKKSGESPRIPTRRRLIYRTALLCQAGRCSLRESSATASLSITYKAYENEREVVMDLSAALLETVERLALVSAARFLTY